MASTRGMRGSHPGSTKHKGKRSGGRKARKYAKCPRKQGPYCTRACKK